MWQRVPMSSSGPGLDALPDPLHVDLSIAAIRGAFGIALLAAPGTVIALLAGRDARSPAAKVMARAAGVRDIAMAVTTVWALDRPADLARTSRLHAVVDATDAAAGLVAFRRLTPLGRTFAVLGGSSSAAVGWWQSQRWRERYGNGDRAA